MRTNERTPDCNYGGAIVMRTDRMHQPATDRDAEAGPGGPHA